MQEVVALLLLCKLGGISGTATEIAAVITATGGGDREPMNDEPDGTTTKDGKDRRGAPAEPGIPWGKTEEVVIIRVVSS
jgi:hypothetical protein